MTFSGEWEWQAARAQCMYACTDPTRFRRTQPLSGRCPVRVQQKRSRPRLACRDSIRGWLTN